MTATLRDRVLSRLTVDPSGCLLWTGATTANGYGVVSVNGKLEYVHRLMYRWFVGPIPDGHQVDHLCRVRRCAGPVDLEAVTQLTNIMRGEAVTVVNAGKTHCDNDHEFTEANTYYRRDRTGRQCRACRRARRKAKVRLQDVTE